MIDKCETIIREELIKKCGNRCQFCGRTTGLGLFHILSKGAWPRIRLHKDNLLIVCWFPCHNKFHHDPYHARDYIFPKIKDIKGEDYELKLWQLNESMPRLTMVELERIHKELLNG